MRKADSKDSSGERAQRERFKKLAYYTPPALLANNVR
jgi:hypothetical protein